MAISASLKGRLRNTSLPKSRALLPLFEAVVNAIQAVDEIHDDMGRTRIEVTILREQQEPLEFGQDQQTFVHAEPIHGFIVSDNGEGFHDKNMESFETLDSEYRSEYGCRGVGRLLWLKAFTKVEVESRYLDAQEAMQERKFVFTGDSGVSQHSARKSQESERGSEVRLLSFMEEYRQSAPKNTIPIAKSILEHCLWYFVRPGGAPKIVIIDDSERLDLNALFNDYMLTSSQGQGILVKKYQFDLVHLRLRAASRPTPQLNWCAAKRVVFEENLSGKVPGLHGKLTDGETEFMYSCFLTSSFLDKAVRSERTGFDIPEVSEGTLDEDEPSMSDIREAVLAAAEHYLHQNLAVVKEAGRVRVQNFVEKKAPQYRPILRHIDEDKLSVDPAIGDRELELQLHRHFVDLEIDLLAEGQRVLASDDMEIQEYNDRLEEYLEKVDDIKKSDLAAYVFRRKVILDLIAKAIQIDKQGNYAKEDVLHNLIMRVRSTSDDPVHKANNLWVIDEGLAFHNYLASDKTISSMPITGSTSTLEPDLLALKVNDGPFLVSERDGPSLASIVVVEIKRPMRKDAGNPLSQAVRYLERVREGRVKTAKGRPIPKSDHIPGFCYIISDLTSAVKESCKQFDLRPTQDGQGYFGYNNSYKAYIEVNSFDRLLSTANERNRAFFDSLGIPVT